MDISELVTTDYEEVRPDTPLSKVVGTFEDSGVKAVLVRDDGGFQGVITRRQLAVSHRHPGQTAGTVVWHVPRLDPREDVREVARLMVGGDSRVLPVFEGEDLVGVVTADDILAAVASDLDALTVDDVATVGIVTLDPEDTVGRALNVFREEHVTHLPVVDEGRTVGVLSLHDVAAFAAREVERSQDGAAPSGGEGGMPAGIGRGGLGAREGERARLLDLPVRDKMSEPARTVTGDEGLGTAVGRMLDLGISSLVVVDDGPSGIVTMTDALDALTVGAEGHRAVQVYGVDLMDDLTHDDVVAMVDGFDDHRGDMRVLDARVHLHEHEETYRGTPLLLARVRIDTDRGLYTASGTGFGAKEALNDARGVLERRVRDDKTYGRSKKHPDEEYWERRFGWWLEG